MTAIVTGGAQGIGAAIARRLAADALHVAVCDINGAGAQEIAKEVGGTAYEFDLGRLANSGEAIDLVQLIASECGPIRALVNAAGICLTHPIDDIGPEDWQRTLSINLVGPFFLLRACADSMLATGTQGSIVNIVSVSGFLPKLEQIEYGASKAGLVSLTRSSALIYGPKGIRVNAIAPGVIETPMTQANAERRARIRGITPEEALAPLLAQIPLGRIGLSEEVAEVASFLISERASYVNGQTIDVCGGSLMR